MSRKNRVHKICVACSAPFDVPASHASQRFCSHLCKCGGPAYIADEATQCWNWQYGVYHYSKTPCKQLKNGSEGAHRYVWKSVRGALADDTFLVQTCNNKMCVNPDHFKPVGAKEYGAMAPRVLKARTSAECRNGHAWTADNTYVNPSNMSRTCRVCTSHSQKKYLMKGCV
jgi:hypothetical protein